MVHLYKHKRNIQNINIVIILDKIKNIDRLILLVSPTRVQAVVVHHMMSCFPAISLRLSSLMCCNVDGVERLKVAQLLLAAHRDV
jgi:SUMO ligase MMS21 Smc5/6 complex component